MEESRSLAKEEIYAESSIDLLLVKQLLKHPPNRLHKGCVKGLVVVVKVDPTPDSIDRSLPFRRVSHHNVTTRLIVIPNAWSG
jgi:hypothetical protein